MNYRKEFVDYKKNTKGKVKYISSDLEEWRL